MIVRPKLAISLMATFLAACGLAVSDAERIRSADEQMQAGDYRAAAIQLKNVLTRSPENYEARLMLARIHVGQNDILSAEKEVQSATELGAPADQISVLRLDILEAQGEYAEMLAAVGLVEDILSPTRLLQYRGTALIGLRNGVAAEAVYRNWLAIDSGSSDAATGLAKARSIQGHVDEAVAMLNELVVRDPLHADGWLALAVLHYSLGDYEKSRDAYRHSLAVRKPQTHVLQTVFALVGLSDTDLMLQDAEAAHATIELLKAYAPTAPQTMLQSTRLSLLKQDFPEAARKLQRLDRLIPGDVRILTLLATVQWRLGNIQQAASHLARVVSLAPNNLHARKMLAQMQLRQANTSAALETLDPLLNLQEGDPELYGLLAIADLQRGNPRSAIARLEEAIRLNPDDRESKSQLAEVLLRTGEPERAVDLMSALEFSADGDFRRERILLAGYRQMRQLTQGSTIADRLAGIDPPLPAALNLAADYYIETGKSARGREILERLRDIDPNNIDTLLRLAQLEISENQPDSAGALYRSVTRIDADNLAALVGIARVSVETGDTAAAIQFLQLACEKHPEEILPRLLLAKTFFESGNIAAAESQAREIVRMGPIDPTVNRSMGRLLMQVGAMAEARAQFETAVRNAPASIEALLDLAYNLIAQEEIQQASEVLGQALMLSPNSRAAQAAMVVVELRQDHQAAAAQRLNSLRQHYPDDQALLILHGEVQFASAQFQQAAETFGIAVSNGAGLSTIMRQVASLRKAETGPESARPLLEWIDANPGDLMAQIQLAQHYQESGDSKRSIEVYERIHAAKPDDPAIMNNLAWEHHLAGNHDRARSLAEMAIELNPDSSEIADTLGTILHSVGDLENSIKYLRAAVALAPHNAEIHYHLADVLAEAGNTKEAYRMLETIFETDQDFPSKVDAMALYSELN